MTTFTLSDFSRTYVPNGTLGTDHAWASHHFVAGGALRGSDFYGLPTSNGTIFPTLAAGAGDDTDNGTNARGRFVPSVGVDQFGATLASWFGVSDADLPAVFPNINNLVPGICFSYRWKAILPAKNTYMWFLSDPGPLDLCGFGGGGIANNHGYMSLRAEAGRTYFIEGSPGGDLAGRLRASVRAAPESEGAKAIAESELAQITFEGFSGKKFDEGWRSLHEGMLPKEVFELLGRTTPPEIRSDSDSKWDQDGYKFAFSKGKLKSWSKPKPYVFKVKKFVLKSGDDGRPTSSRFDQKMRGIALQLEHSVEE